MKFIKKIITDFVCSETGDFIISMGMSILVLLALVVLVGICIGGITFTAYITYGTLCGLFHMFSRYMLMVIGFAIGIILFIFIIGRN